MPEGTAGTHHRLSPEAAQVDPRGNRLGTAQVPGGGRLELFWRGDDYEMMFEDEQLMGSWSFRSEQQLATLALARVTGAAPCVLIGGLGMGFTLSAARAALPLDAAITVAELVLEVVEWGRGPLAHLVDPSLRDPRVSVLIRDVHDVVVEARGKFDAILLDVDNGPEGLIAAANERLYCAWGLRDLCTALRPGGILGVWSAFADDGFTDRLCHAGFTVESVVVPPSHQRDQAHTLWFATAPWKGGA